MKFSKTIVATAVAILFHLVGLVGILFYDRLFFASLTPFILLLMAILIIWTQEEKNISFWLFMTGCILEGIAVEIAGVNTGAIFGEYSYGHLLGPGLFNVPLVIGINWFIVIYCSGIFITRFFGFFMRKSGEEKELYRFYNWSLVIDGALLAVFFDWIMEPVAIKLGFWTWLGDAGIPLSNYISWFVLAVIMLFMFRKAMFDKLNQFAVNLLLIQLMFFLILRIYL